MKKKWTKFMFWLVHDILPHVVDRDEYIRLQEEYLVQVRLESAELRARLGEVIAKQAEGAK
jgi:hypothetical protein